MYSHECSAELISFNENVLAYMRVWAGRNFGDEGLCFLAESLGYNQVGFLEQSVIVFHICVVM